MGLLDDITQLIWISSFPRCPRTPTCLKDTPLRQGPQEFASRHRIRLQDGGWISPRLHQEDQHGQVCDLGLLNYSKNHNHDYLTPLLMHLLDSHRSLYGDLGFLNKTSLISHKCFKENSVCCFICRASYRSQHICIQVLSKTCVYFQTPFHKFTTFQGFQGTLGTLWTF